MAIPASVTKIGNYAFYKCSSLTQITINSSVISIGNHVFSECSSLEQIELSSSIRNLYEIKKRIRISSKVKINKV